MTWFRFLMAVVVGISLVLPAVSLAQASNVPSSTARKVATDSQRRGPHGGRLQTVETIRAETVAEPAGLQVYLYTRDGVPLQLNRARGVATVSVPGNPKRYRYELVWSGQQALAANIDLSRLAGLEIGIRLQIVGVTDQTLSYQTLLAVVNTEAETVTRGSAQVRPGVFKVTLADKPFIAAQKQCPVMNEPLDAMGGPYQVDAGGKAIYICCPGCAKKIADQPQRYLTVLKSRGVTAPTIQ